jgi:uncharacterized protein (TIGR03546 family)
MIPGLTPTTSPHNLLVLLALLLFKVNIAAAILSWAVFSIFAYALDPLFHQIGLFLLTGLGNLKELWTVLYNTPLIPYTRFNNTLMLGSLIFSLLAFYPVYFVGLTTVVKYRETIMESLNRWKVIQAVKASKLYNWYTRLSELRG